MRIFRFVITLIILMLLHGCSGARRPSGGSLSEDLILNQQWTLLAPSRIESAIFSADGSLLLVGRNDGVISAYSVVTGSLLYDLVGHHSPVSALATAASGTLLVSGSGTAIHTSDTSVRCWDLISRQEMAKIPDGYPIKQVAASDDGLIAAWLSSDEYNAKLQVQEIRGRNLILRADGLRETAPLLTFGPSNKMKVVALRKTWAIDASNSPRLIEQHPGPVIALGSDSDGYYCLRQRQLRSPPNRQGDIIVDAPSILLFGNSEIAPREVWHLKEFNSDQDYVRGFAIPRAGNDIWLWSTYKLVQVNLMQESEILLLESPAGNSISASAISPDSKIVAIATGSRLTLYLLGTR